MVTLIFEAHSTSNDNEAKLSSGWNDVELSELGLQQSKELGERYRDKPIDAVFCSDLYRAVQTATIAFGQSPRTIYVDWRLRECDYGDITQHPSSDVEPEKIKHITEPFPNGESYEQTGERMKSFLSDLLQRFDGSTVMVIGHRATQYGLEHWINGQSYEKLVAAEFKWQPGWTYTLDKDLQ